MNASQPNPDRALSELSHFCQSNEKRLEIIYAPYHPIDLLVNDVFMPHTWRVRIQDRRRPDPDYLGWGVTINDAILECHRNWQEGRLLSNISLSPSPSPSQGEGRGGGPNAH